MRASNVVVAALCAAGAQSAPDAEHSHIVKTLQARGLSVDDFSFGSGKPQCSFACSALQFAYGSQNVVQKSDTATYQAFKSSFWSQQQQQANPFCVFKVPNNVAVSTAILVSRLTSCPFTVRSGGHAAFTNSSNSDGGISISFENLKGITVSKDRSIVTVEPGNTWGPLYKTLQAQGLAVIGGRVADIGTGGLTLGGGISFFSNKRGWAADNVASFEVVLASGAIVTASPTQNADLYKALRGGGNNFGVVTKLNLYAFELPGQIWGGSRYVANSDAQRLSRAFAEVNQNAYQDLKAGNWLQNVLVGPTRYVAVERWYSEPNGGNSSIWGPYNAIPTVGDQARNVYLADYAASIEAVQPRGFRQFFYTITIKNDPELTVFATETFATNAAKVAALPGFVGAQTFQTIDKPLLETMKVRGGNAYNLDPAGGPYQIVLLGIQWNNAEDDDALYKFASDTARQIKDEACKRGLNQDYLYMNYASKYQDVIASYGKEQKDFLIKTGKKYDPSGVFQTLQPGYYKLNRAPVVDPAYFSY